MARRKRRRSDGGSGIGTAIGIVVLVAIIGSSLGTYGYLKWKVGKAIVLDPVTFCPETGPLSTTVVVLDLTDPVSPPTLMDIRNRVENLMGDIDEGGKLVVFGLTERQSEIESKVSVCNPGDGDNVDPIISNPRFARQRWETAYRAPIDAFIEGLRNQASGSRSPIMAGIQQAALAEFAAPNSTLGKKHLIVVSDMLEHTDVFSHYRQGASFAAFEGSNARDMFRIALNGVEVTILLVQRLNAPIPQLELADFWASWFRSNKAEDVRIVRLAGAS